MWWIKNLLFRLVNPRFWIQNAGTDWQWDAWLYHAIDSEEIEIVDQWHIKIGGHWVWVENYPYCYGDMKSGVGTGLPAPLTRVKLKKAVAETMLNKKPAK